jgi:hypothetical protein
MTSHSLPESVGTVSLACDGHAYTREGQRIEGWTPLPDEVPRDAILRFLADIGVIASDVIRVEITQNEVILTVRHRNADGHAYVDMGTNAMVRSVATRPIR